MLKALSTLGCFFGAAGAAFSLSLQPVSANERAPLALALASCATQHADAAVVEAVQPDFPPLARDMLASGTTYVRVDLAASGALRATSVFQSSGHAMLDREALAAARWSTYRPEIANCSAVGGSYIYAVEFVP